LSGKRLSYNQVKNNDWLIQSVLSEFKKIIDGSGHGKIIITIQNYEIFEIECSTKNRNPKYKKGINTCKLGKI